MTRLRLEKELEKLEEWEEQKRKVEENVDKFIHVMRKLVHYEIEKTRPMSKEEGNILRLCNQVWENKEKWIVIPDLEEFQVFVDNFYKREEDANYDMSSYVEKFRNSDIILNFITSIEILGGYASVPCIGRK